MPDVEMPPRIDAIPILDDNYVWVLHDDRSALVVDPGVAEPVDAWLRQHQLALTTILITHHHGDHIGGVDTLCRQWPDARVIAPDDARIPVAHQRVGEGDPLEIPAPSCSLRVWAVPGHTSSHIAYVGDGLVFCGDTLFSAGCGRLFEGTAEQMLQSLQRLSALPDSTAVYCTHEYTQGNCAFARHVDPENASLAAHAAWVNERRARGLSTLPSRIDRERAINPFLRSDQPAVRQALHRHSDLPMNATDSESFAALRSWKDGFRG